MSLYRTAAQSCSGAARQKGESILTGDFDNSGNLLGGLWKYNCVRLVFENGEGVAFIHQQFGFVGHHSVFSDDAAKFFDDFRAHYLVRSLTVSINCLTRSS